MTCDKLTTGGKLREGGREEAEGRWKGLRMEEEETGGKRRGVGGGCMTV